MVDALINARPFDTFHVTKIAPQTTLSRGTILAFV